MKILHALVKSSLVFVLVEGERLLSLIFETPTYAQYGRCFAGFPCNPPSSPAGGLPPDSILAGRCPAIFHHPQLGACPQTLFFIFFLVARKKTEAKERTQKRPELGGRLHIFPNHSMNSLRSNSISYFVAQIAHLQSETQC